MHIKLEDYLARKRVTLGNFIKINKIKSYQEVLDYCKQRECLPITKEDFEILVPPVSALQKRAPEPKIEEKAEEKSGEKKATKTKTRRKRKSTVSRQAQKVEKERTPDKPIEDS